MKMDQTKRIIRGKVYVLGNDIDTDLIIPAKYLNLVPTIPDELKKLGSYALAGLPDEFPRFVTEGYFETEFPIVVAGNNFGCGSSREHAPIALAAAGVRAVIAHSFARIFLRNVIATGEFYPIETTNLINSEFKTGQEVAIHLDTHEIKQLSTGQTFPFQPLGDVAPIVEAGGIFEFARQQGMLKKQ